MQEGVCGRCCGGLFCGAGQRVYFYFVQYGGILCIFLRWNLSLNASPHDRQQNLVAVVELLVNTPGGLRCVRWHHQSASRKVAADTV